MIAILAWLMISQPASALNVQRFFVLCADDTVHLACSWPECNDTTAPSFGEDLCADRGGVVSRGNKTLRRREIEGTLDNVAARLEKEEAERIALEEQAERVRVAAEEFRRTQQELREIEEERNRRLAEETAERRAVSEREMQACRDRQTYPLRLWACPQLSEWGWYVDDPALCSVGPYEDSPASEHAVLVDFGVDILPSEDRCEFTYPLYDGADFTGADMMQDVLGKVNDNYTEDCYYEGCTYRRLAEPPFLPAEWLTVDIITPVKQAYLSMEQAHLDYLKTSRLNIRDELERREEDITGLAPIPSATAPAPAQLSDEELEALYGQ